MSSTPPAEILLYIGTYTRRETHVLGKSEGIYIYRFNTTSGELTPVGITAGIANPSFLALDPQLRYLYAVSELGEHVEGRPAGAVTAFVVEETGLLTRLNQQSTQGTSPCHLRVDSWGRNVVVANYSSGSVCVLPIGADGSLGAATDFVQHEGSSVNPQRQQEPHPHSINMAGGNRYVLVPDLGLDKILIYEFDAALGTLSPNPAQPWARAHSGAGPRHSAFHPNDRFLYVCNEIDSTVTVFVWDGERASLTEVQSLSTLPADFDGKSWTADIHVHPSGRYVYVSNRGHNSITVFSIHDVTGELTLVEHTSTRGEFPRNFALDPTGMFLLVANQNTDDVYVFHIDPKNGKLSYAEQSIQVPTPVCLRFLSNS